MDTRCRPHVTGEAIFFNSQFHAHAGRIRRKCIFKMRIGVSTRIHGCVFVCIL
jgi:hypothetical protein